MFTGTKGGPLREAVWQTEWVRARESIGLPDPHFHDLRHVAATLAAETAARQPPIVRSQLGHDGSRVTDPQGQADGICP